MPTYNRSSRLSGAIKSVIKQSCSNWKLIIVDDGSIDNTKETVMKFLGDERISYHYQKNSGVSAARNLGIELAKTDYVIFLDSDDYFLPDLFERLSSEDLKKYDLICWWTIKQNGSRRDIWKPRKLEAIYNYVTASFLAGSICYRKDLLTKVGGFDTNLEFGENYELGIRICQNELTIKLINKSYLVIKSRSRSDESIPQRLHSCIYQYKKHRELFQKDRLSESRIFYMIAYFLERSSKLNQSMKFYNYSWQSNPWNMKAIIKLLYFKFQRAI